MRFRRIKSKELNAWYRFCGESFGIGETYFRMHFENDPWRDLDGIFVCVADDMIVGSVRVFDRKVYLNGSVEAMGGIGEVCTKASYRGKGIARRLLAMAIDYMNEKHFKLSVLGSGADGLYESFGWQSRDLTYTKVTLDSKEFSDIKLVTPALGHLERFKSLYEAFSCNLNGPVVRDSNIYWEKWFVYEANKRTYFKSIFYENNMIGYIVLNLKGEVYKVEECILDKTYEYLFEDLLCQVAYSMNIEKMTVLYSSVYRTSNDPDEVVTNSTWMYKGLGLSDTVAFDKSRSHVIWGLDYF